jgi:hypothetical protein
MLPDGVRVECLHVIRVDGISNIHGGSFIFSVGA